MEEAEMKMRIHGVRLVLVEDDEFRDICPGFMGSDAMQDL